MKKPPLTPEQKEWKQLDDRLLVACNRIKSAFSFGKIKTYYDFLVQSGFADDYISSRYFKHELERTLTFEDIKDLLEDFRLGERASLWLKQNPPDTTPEVTTPQLPLIIPPSNLATTVTQPSVTLEIEDDYGLPPRIGSKIFLFWFQKKAVKQMLDAALFKKLRALLLVSGTGTGKTYMISEFIIRLRDNGFFNGCISPWPCIWVTRASVVEQTERVVRQFGLDPINEVTVINIDQLRSKLGEIFVKEEIKIDHGEEFVKYTWKHLIHPRLIIWDECQCIKNEDSQQSRIAQAFNDISDYTFQLFSSATPFTRVIEAKCFCVATRIKHDFGFAKGIQLTNNHWRDFATTIASDNGKSPTQPEDHSPAAIDRLMTRMDEWIIRVRGIKTQYKPLNKVDIIDFETVEDRIFYENAWERYLEEKAKAEKEYGEGSAQTRWTIIVQFLKFRQAAELCRAHHLAEAMYESVTKDRRAACCAVNFKHTIIKVVKLLIEEFNVPREKISLIWGGGNVESKKQKQKRKITSNQDALAILDEVGLSLKDLDLDEVEDNILEKEEVPDAYKLGIQSRKERQSEIDKFQSGRANYCLFTFKSGGVGLSLHHTDEFTKAKVRRKSNGYAFEEDIPNIPTRPRICFLAPTYSAMELVQGLGRTPRLTSLSDTPQLVVFYGGTIEERVARIVSVKLRCLGKVVRQHESWEDVVVDASSREDNEAAVIRHTQDSINGSQAEEDEDETYGDTTNGEEE